MLLSKYQHHLKQSYIDNAEKPYTIKIQQYNNNIVNKKVNSLANGEDYTPNRFDMENTLFKYNAPLVMMKYQRIINSPYVDTSAVQKVLIKNNARNMVSEISKVQVDRINKNLDYIEKAVKDVRIDIKRYNQTAKNFPNVDRVNILQKSVDSGKLWTGKELDYKQLDRMSRSLNKYAENQSELEKWEIANEQAIHDGFEPVKTHKRWSWSNLENTRHSGMDDTVVPINESFVVVNEVTNDTDYLMFPQDVNNDTNNCSNICNCECSVDYLTKEEAGAYL